MFSTETNDSIITVGNKTSTLTTPNSTSTSLLVTTTTTKSSNDIDTISSSQSDRTNSQLDDDSSLFNIQVAKENKPFSPSSPSSTNFPSPSLLILNQSTNNNLLSPKRASQRLSLASPLSPLMIFNEQQENQSTTSPMSSPDLTNGNSPPKSRWSKLKSAFKRESKQQPSADRLKSFQQQYGDSYQHRQNQTTNMELASHSFASLPSSSPNMTSSTSNHSSLLQSSKSSPSLYNTSPVDNTFRESSASDITNHQNVSTGIGSSSSSMNNSVNSVTSYHHYLQSSSSSGTSIVSPSSTLSSVGVLENPMISMIMNDNSSRFSPPLSNLIESGTTSSPPSPFSENLSIQTQKRVTSPLTIQSGNEVVSKTALTENYNNNTSQFTPPTPNENSDEVSTLQTTRKTKGNIKRLISMLTPRRRKSISKSEPSTKVTQPLKITSPSNDDPALLDVAHKRKLFETRSYTESNIHKEPTPKTPRGTDDEQIKRLVNERIVSSKIQQFNQNEEIGLSQRKYSVSGKIANWLKAGSVENGRLTRSFTDDKKEKRKSVFDFGKRDFDLTPVIETTSVVDTPSLSTSTNEKLKRLISKHHSANTPYTNPLSTLNSVKTPNEESMEEEEEPVPPTLSSSVQQQRNLLVPTLNLNNEDFKRTTEEIINENVSSLLSNESECSDIGSSEDTSSSVHLAINTFCNDDIRAAVTSPTGALSPSSLEYNTTIAPEYGDDDEESIVTTIDYVPYTKYEQVKPKQLYAFVLEQFINNHNLDDQKCAEQFESFMTGYLEFCRQADESKSEELKDHANFSENDIPKMRDFEKPKCFLLHQSAKRNRSSLIFILVTKYGCSIDAEDDLESTPLHWATSHRAIDSILVLCQLGGKINIRDKYGKAPIHLLFAKAFYDEEHFEMESATKCFKAAQMMCNMFEGDYNFKTSEGSTVLHMACDQGRMEAVKFLVSESNDINTSDNVGTAFASSTQSGNKVLLNAKDKFGKTPLMRAATKGHIAIVEFIITNSKPNVVFGPMSRDERKQNVLHQAALQGLDALVNRIAFLNPSACATMMQEQDASGNSPLHLAVSKGNIKTVNLFLTLLTKEVVNVVNEKGETPLHLACKVKDKPAAEKICRYLLQNGANPDVKDSKHQTPRMLAAENELQISFGKKRK